MQIEVIPFSSVIPDDYNPRKELNSDDTEYQRIKNSMDAFGYIEPMVYNIRTGHIVGGHQRLKIMQARGLTEAEMSVVDLDDNEEKLLNLRLNKIKGRWDEDALTELLSQFTIDEALLTGFGSDELSVILAQNDDLDMDAFDFEPEPTGAAEELDGANWVIILKFQNKDDARQWCEEHGYPKAVKKNSMNSVIRVFQSEESTDGA